MAIKALSVESEEKNQNICNTNGCNLPKLEISKKCLKHYQGKDGLLKYAQKVYQFIVLKCPGEEACIYACGKSSKGNLCIEDYSVFIETLMGYRELIKDRKIPVDQYLCERIGDMTVKRLILLRSWRKLQSESSTNNNLNDWKGVLTVLDRIQESLRRDVKELEITPEGRRKTNTDKSSGYKSLAECVSKLMNQETVQNAIGIAKMIK